MLGRPGSCAATHHFGERLANIDRQEQSKPSYHAFGPGLRHRLIPLSQYVRGIDSSVTDALDLVLSRVVEQDPGIVVGLGREPKSAGQEAAQGRQTATPTKAQEVSKVTRGIFFLSGLLTDLASSQLSGQTRWPFRHTFQVIVQPSSSSGSSSAAVGIEEHSFAEVARNIKAAGVPPAYHMATKGPKHQPRPLFPISDSTIGVSSFRYRPITMIVAVPMNGIPPTSLVIASSTDWPTSSIACTALL